MDFFEHQEQARQITHRLIVYFVLAVVLIILSVYLSVNAVSQGMGRAGIAGWWNPDLFLAVAAVTVGIIFVGSAYKVSQLAQGGAVVADWLGGRPIDSNTPDFRQRRLLNVVEEMAIASGTPVPTVFLLPEETGINAFAAGFTLDDAVIGVTRGTVDHLSRDELQGVIAHEFSHILNGDMRLNIRLIGILHGILVIALIGRGMIRGAARTRGKKDQGNPILFLGIALFAIGSVGVLFGRLIKSAVSRQREFLADASAVQFTRQPDGIAGALRKIGGLVYGSTLSSKKAEEASHLLFADGVGKAAKELSLLDLKTRTKPKGIRQRFYFLATHPPLEERIRRIDPSFDGTFPAVEPRASVELEEEGISAAASPPAAAAAYEGNLSIQPPEMTQLVGTLTPVALAYAASLLGDLDAQLKALLHEPVAARAVVLALLLSPESNSRKIQFQLLQSADQLLARQTLDCSTLIDRSPPEARLPLLDLALPALRQLSPAQYQEFTALVEGMIQADKRIDMFEYTLQHVLRRHLKPTFESSPPPGVKYRTLAELREDISTLLSCLARTGQTGRPAEAQQALLRGIKELGENSVPDKLGPAGPRQLEKLGPALDRLNRLAPLLKRQLIQACGATVIHDGEVTPQEGELLRATADALDCPIPPIAISTLQQQKAIK